MGQMTQPASLVLRTNLWLLVSAVLILQAGKGLAKSNNNNMIAREIQAMEARLEALYNSDNTEAREVRQAEARLSMLYNLEDTPEAERQFPALFSLAKTILLPAVKQIGGDLLGGLVQNVAGALAPAAQGETDQATQIQAIKKATKAIK